MARKRFYLPKSDRHGLLLLMVVLIAFVVGRWIYKSVTAPDDSVAVSANDRKEIAEFEASLRADSVKKAEKYRKQKEAEAELFYFDPNTADSLTLRRLGLKPWQIHNMMKYRAHNGRWKNPEDFARLYGLSDEDFQRLLPYIIIEPTERDLAQQQRDARHDSIAHLRTEKYPAGTRVDLNTADTTMLKHIPGIGSYYASKICKRRELLGGFVSSEQIKEIEGLPDDILNWVTVSPDYEPRKININKATFKELVRHPYLSYEQVKVIENYRKTYGTLHGWQELMLSDEFDEATVRRASPYFSF